MEPRYRLRENFYFVTDFLTLGGGILGLIGSRLSSSFLVFLVSWQLRVRDYESLIPIGPLLSCLVSDWFRPTSCLAAVESSPPAARTGPSRSGIWTISTTHTISGYQETSVPFSIFQLSYLFVIQSWTVRCFEVFFSQHFKLIFFV